MTLRTVFKFFVAVFATSAFGFDGGNSPSNQTIPKEPSTVADDLKKILDFYSDDVEDAGRTEIKHTGPIIIQGSGNLVIPPA